MNAIKSDSSVAALYAVLISQSDDICSVCISHRWPPVSPGVEHAVFLQDKDANLGEVLRLRDDYAQQVQQVICSTCDVRGRRNLGFASCFETTVQPQLSVLCLPLDYLSDASTCKQELGIKINTSRSIYTPVGVILQHSGQRGHVLFLSDVGFLYLIARGYN